MRFMGAKNQKLKKIATRKIFKRNKNHVEKSFRIKNRIWFYGDLKELFVINGLSYKKPSYFLKFAKKDKLSSIFKEKVLLK